MLLENVILNEPEPTAPRPAVHERNERREARPAAVPSEEYP